MFEQLLSILFAFLAYLSTVWRILRSVENNEGKCLFQHISFVNVYLFAEFIHFHFIKNLKQKMQIRFVKLKA
jgi:hypothetical protein